MVYARILEHLLGVGERVQTRNAPVRRWFTWECGFHRTPLVCLRKTAWKHALREWQWFMSGSNYLRDLHPDVRHWWQPWADKDGAVRFNYSEQFRRYTAVDPVSGFVGQFDQIANLIDGIRDHPYSRRNVVTTWNPPEMASPLCPITNCHGSIIQAFVRTDNSLSLAVYQRSMDVICGLPHNWIQYFAFLMWLANRAGRAVGRLMWIAGDMHLYDEHEELAQRILQGLPQPGPSLVYTPTSEEFLADDFTLDGPYVPTNTETARMVV